MLYERLQNRNYSEEKIKENVECEIFQTLLEEARESYNIDIVHELDSNTPDDMDKNLDQIIQWIASWKTLKFLYDDYVLFTNFVSCINAYFSFSYFYCI